jgi:hypothetical protein
MGNRGGFCSGTPAQHCVDECIRLQFELDGRSRDADDPDCDPAGAVFTETLLGLGQLESQLLRFSGTSNLSAIRWLIAMGATLKARDRYGTGVLHAACRSGSVSVVLDLLPRGLPLDATDSAGWTPLHVAAVMGRREVCRMLLEARACLTVVNKRGRSAEALCSDHGTNQVLREAAMGKFQESTSRVPQVVVVPQDEDSATCEPFFVPRLPMFRDSRHKDELIYLGSEVFAQSAGHGLAFFVASGLVHDHPSDLSSFVVKHRLNPTQLGSFLGEDFSLAKTIRLAFIHSVDLSGTGVVSALAKAFQHIKAPSDLQKIDRLVTSVAHLWWRTHDLGDGLPTAEAESRDWTSFIEDGAANDVHKDVQQGETIRGLELRCNFKSVDALQRLMFSTVMLCWNAHGEPDRLPMCPRMSLRNWLDINAGVDADASDIPTQVQMAIYEQIMARPPQQLLPDPGGVEQVRAAARHVAAPRDKDEEIQRLLHGGNALPDKAAGVLHNALAMQDETLAVRGWAVIPKDGLTRMETGSRLPLKCILSETSGPLGAQAQPQAPGQGEVVWLSLRFSFILLLATSPDDTPYAFIRLQDAALQEVRPSYRQLVLSGRCESVKGADQRLPLQLCFILADGRFQPFEALWFELELKSNEEFETWSQELGVACGEDQHSKAAQRGPGAQLHAAVGEAHQQIHSPKGPRPAG